MMFDRLKALRAKLAAVPSHLCDATTRKEIVEAIDELDDAMVADVRLQTYVRATVTPLAPEFHEELLALFAGSATASNEEKVA